MPDLSGREIGGCRLVKPIGVGGMGEVYLAEQVRLGSRKVAVKVVQLDDALGTQKIDDIQRRFTQEAALLGSFSNPHILPVHDAGYEDGMLYLVMEYVPDGSLADAMRPGPRQQLAPPLSPALAADLIGQVAAALQYTHDRGVVHRDVKPGNILARHDVDGAWQLLLADFGIAKAMQDAQQKTQVSGTLAYMAPEQFSGSFSPATDQYALAVVAYQLLAGRPPFEGDMASVTQAHLNQSPPSMRSLNPAIPPALDAVVLRALAKSPADRYPSVAAFAQALHEVAAQPGTSPAGERPAAKPPRWPVAPPPAPPRKPPSVGRAWLAVVAAVVLLVAAGVGADLLHLQSQGPNASATQTAQSGAAASAAAGNAATQTAQALGTQTVVGFAATQTAAAFIPTATATAGLGDDVTSPPPAPAQAGAIAFADAAPTCDGDAALWQKDDNTQVQCLASGSGVDVSAQSPGTLGCIEYHTIPNDAYISVLVTPGGPAGSSGAVLGFRQGEVAIGTPTPNVQHLAGVGYFYAVMRSTSTYDLYQYDASTHRSDLTQGVLSSGPAADFAMGVLVQGSQMTLYVNGQALGAPITDTQHAQGWISLCTPSLTTFRDVQVYALKS